MWKVNDLFVFFVFLGVIINLHPKRALVATAFQSTRLAACKIHSRLPLQKCQIKRSLSSSVVNIDRHVAHLRLSERPPGEDGGENIDSKRVEEEKSVGGNSFMGWIESRKIDDYGLIIGDVFAIILASQLMGLLDVLNDPEFSRQGGWLQPIPAVPSTLGTLVERISTLSLLWFVAAFSEEESFTFTAVEDEKSSILVALTITVNFVALRCILEAVLGFTSGSNYNGNIIENAQLGLALRDCYFVALGLPTFRFLYSKILV